MRCLVFFSFMFSWMLPSMNTVGLADALDVTLIEGDPAPVFEAPTTDGSIWRSEDHVGRKFIVVYFYPADLTGGCTRQACGFRDQMKELNDAGVEVVGVSGDSVDNHQLFSKVNSLNFPLLSDEDGTIMRMVDGVERSLSRGVTASRWTFLIDPDGRIVHKNTEVDAEHDSQKILETIRRITAQTE